MTPLALKNSLKKYTNTVLEQMVSNVILEDKEILQVKYEELQSGIRPDGAPIGEYSQSLMGKEYAEYKNNKNPIPGLGQVDLIDTGAFAKGNKVIYIGSKFYTISSSDSKAPALIKKYGFINERINQKAWNRLQKFNYLPKVLRGIKL
tara:strand:+ start:1481 stop:1924 length:444 start_codon:yes stop_codon:yes gene_type:complete